MDTDPIEEPLAGDTVATRLYSSFGPGGECQLFINYNANTGRVNSVDCVNPTPFAVWGAVRSPTTGEWFERVFAANQNTSQAVPAGAIRVRLATDPETDTQYLETLDGNTNQWVGLETQFRYPA